MTGRHRIRRKKSLKSPSVSTQKIEEIQLELTAFLPTREQLGIQIATSGDSIRKVTKNYYKVRAQSSNGWYSVKKLQEIDVWTCECKDFLYRLNKEGDKKCKHIIAVQTLQKTFETESKIEPVERPKICPKCSSAEIVKHGFRMVKGGMKRQRYACLKCKFRFILGENGFSKVSSDPQIIIESLNLILSGMSYRSTARHVGISHQTRISHTSIANWFTKYVQLMKEYVGVNICS